MLVERNLNIAKPTNDGGKPAPATTRFEFADGDLVVLCGAGGPMEAVRDGRSWKLSTAKASRFTSKGNVSMIPATFLFTVVRDGDMTGFRSVGAEGRMLQAVRGRHKEHRVHNYNFGTWEKWHCPGLQNCAWPGKELGWRVEAAGAVLCRQLADQATAAAEAQAAMEAKEEKMCRDARIMGAAVRAAEDKVKEAELRARGLSSQSNHEFDDLTRRVQGHQTEVKQAKDKATAMHHVVEDLRAQLSAQADRYHASQRELQADLLAAQQQLQASEARGQRLEAQLLQSGQGGALSEAAWGGGAGHGGGGGAGPSGGAPAPARKPASRQGSHASSPHAASPAAFPGGRWGGEEEVEAGGLWEPPPMHRRAPSLSTLDAFGAGPTAGAAEGAMGNWDSGSEASMNLSPLSGMSVPWRTEQEPARGHQLAIGPQDKGKAPMYPPPGGGAAAATWVAMGETDLRRQVLRSSVDGDDRGSPQGSSSRRSNSNSRRSRATTPVPGGGLTPRTGSPRARPRSAGSAERRVTFSEGRTKSRSPSAVAAVATNLHRASFEESPRPASDRPAPRSADAPERSLPVRKKLDMSSPPSKQRSTVRQVATAGAQSIALRGEAPPAPAEGGKMTAKVLDLCLSCWEPETACTCGDNVAR